MTPAAPLGDGARRPGRARSRRIVAAAALGVVCAADPGAHAAPPEPYALGARVPSSTLAFARVASPRALLAALREGPADEGLAGLGGLAADLEPFFGDLFAETGAALDRAARGEGGSEHALPLPRWLAASPLSARALLLAHHLEADAEFALVSVEEDGPRFGLALDFGAHLSALREALRSLEGDALDLGVRFRPRDDGGVLTLERGRPVRVFLRGSVVLATNDPGLERALTRETPPASGALADLEAFAAVTAPGTLAALLVDPVAFADQSPGLAPGRPARALANALGLAGTVGATYTLRRAEGRFVERVKLAAPGREARLPALVAGKADPFGPSALRPPAPFVHAALGWSPTVLVDRVGRLLRAAHPEALVAFEEARAGWPEGLAAAVDRLVASLDDEGAGWVAPSPQGGLVPEVALAWRTHDAAATLGAVRAAAAAWVAGAVATGRDARLRSAPVRAGAAPGGAAAGAAVCESIDWIEDGGAAADGGARRGRPALIGLPLAPLVEPAWAFAVVRPPGEAGGVLLLALHPHGLREVVARAVDGALGREATPPGASPGAVATLALDLAGTVGRAYDTIVPWLQTRRAGPTALDRLARSAPPTRALLPCLPPVGLSLLREDDGVAVVVRSPLPLCGVAAAAGLVAALVPPDAGGASAAPYRHTTARHPGGDPVRVTTTALEAVRAALLEYRSLYGVLPRRLDDLAAGGLLGVPTEDGWGVALRLTLSEDRGRAVVRSLGPDGVEGTDDDRTVEVRARAK